MISGKSATRLEKFTMISSSCRRSAGGLPRYPWSIRKIRVSSMSRRARAWFSGGRAREKSR
jgi:hypothetical protein